MTDIKNSTDRTPEPNGMNKPGLTGLPRLIAAAGYSVKGVKATWRSEEAFRIEAWLMAIFFPLSFVIGETLSHQLILVITCALVLLAELFNSAIEAIVDRVSTQQHPLSGQAKDIGSAGVFLTLILFGLIWAISLWHYFLG